MAKKKSFYSQTPFVPAKKIAGVNPLGQVSIGAGTPPQIPKSPGGTTSGLGARPTHVFKHHLKPQRQHGHMRFSGHPSAHRIGSGLKKVIKVPK